MLFYLFLFHWRVSKCICFSPHLTIRFILIADLYLFTFQRLKEDIIFNFVWDSLIFFVYIIEERESNNYGCGELYRRTDNKQAKS